MTEIGNGMKSLYQVETANEIIRRVNLLHAGSKAQWGKMSAEQMLTHCTISLEIATGHRYPSRALIGTILGPFTKSLFCGMKPLLKNMPAPSVFIVAGDRNLNEERDRLIRFVKYFCIWGETRCTTHPHPFYGRLSPQEWGVGMYKHLDHHLRQFGV